jgi:mannose-1-phosphate guanylyltransferase
MNWLVIMAGGVGERFWPMSRRCRPKQLLPIVSQRSMIQETLRRVKPFFGQCVVVVTNREQAAAVRKQLPQVKHILAEPAGRNTAPCVAWAAAYIAKRDPDAVMAVVPADSYIRDTQRYRQVVREALKLAKAQDVLITVGIQPTSPHTGYGYIQVGQTLQPGFSKAKRFVEKPDRATAEKYLASGQYRWNAGMFVWSAKTILSAYRQLQLAMLKQVEKIKDARSLARIYPNLEKISVDYAIMEKAGNVVVADGDFGWDDVGDWQAVGQHIPSDAAGNAVRGDFIGVDTTGCVVFSDDKHLIGVVGLQDVVIVHTPDATLVCHKRDAQRVKEIVGKVGEKYR